MKELTTQEIESLHVNGAGGPKFFKVVTGTVLGGVIGGVVGLLSGGPPGMVAGVVSGAITGAGSSIAKEGAEGLYDLHYPDEEN